MLIVTNKLFVLSVIFLNVVIMLIVVMLSVVAPFLLQSIDLDLLGRVRTVQFYVLSMLD